MKACKVCAARIACAPLLLMVLALQGAAALGGGDAGAKDPVLKNGDFEQAGSASVPGPAHWDMPDGLGVQWATAPSGGDGQDRGKAVRMDTAVSEQDMVAQWRRVGIDTWDIPKATAGPVAQAYGLSFYSEAIPIAPGQAYRVSFDFKGPGRGAGAKVWVRAWGLWHGERRRRYETFVNCRVPDGEWHRFSQVFHPTRLRPEVTEMKVMLYAYWPPAVYWFDNVSIEPVSDEEYERDR